MLFFLLGSNHEQKTSVRICALSNLIFLHRIYNYFKAAFMQVLLHARTHLSFMKQRMCLDWLSKNTERDRQHSEVLMVKSCFCPRENVG